MYHWKKEKKNHQLKVKILKIDEEQGGGGGGADAGLPIVKYTIKVTLGATPVFSLIKGV